MSRATSRSRKTVKDWLAVPDGVRAELIGGEIYVTPSSTPLHQEVGCRIREALNAWAGPRDAGKAFVAALDVHLPSGDIVQPDVLFVATAHRAIVQDAIRGVPDLVVEVVSRTHPERDRILKRALYAQNGVREYWIADLASASIEVLRLEDGAYLPTGHSHSGTVLMTPYLPGFCLPVGPVFAPAF